MSGMLVTSLSGHVLFLAGEWVAASVGLGVVMAVAMGGIIGLGVFLVTHMPAVDVSEDLSEHVEVGDQDAGKPSTSPHDLR
jgi:hypothetical protein